MRGLGLCDKALAALDDGGDGLLNRPFADVTERLAADWRLLGGF